MPDVAIAETHISELFFTRDRVYKKLKPVKLSFLDYSERATRLAAAVNEYELNRRIAPDVYLGLGDLRENGEVTDHLITMRRMPADRRLSALVTDPNFPDCVRGVARTIAAFHAAQEPQTSASMATAAALGALWDDNFATLRRHIPAVATSAEFARVEELATGYLRSNEALFAQRIADGFVRDGHGDLIADDIFCLSDGPRILDCLAFRDDFRISDVLADIAFLAMDLHRIAGAHVAQDLMRWYQEFSYEHHPASLAHHYVAYRAHVRAKVACLTHEAGGEGQLELARTYHNLALHHLERARVTVVLIGGAPGVGKSTVAEHLSQEFGACRLVTDEIRKDLSGIGHDVHAVAGLDSGIYDAETTSRAYAELLREAGLLLDAGESVILDASWAVDDQRVAARALARARGARLVEINCVLDRETAQQRIRARRIDGHTPSDATAELADVLAARREAWPEAHVFSTMGELDETLRRAGELLEVCLTREPAIS